MIHARVIGRVWVDKKVDALESRRFLTCRAIDSGATLVAVDLIEAAVGSEVLVVRDEAAVLASGGTATDAAVVALIAGSDPID